MPKGVRFVISFLICFGVEALACQALAQTASWSFGAGVDSQHVFRGHDLYNEAIVSVDADMDRNGLYAGGRAMTGLKAFGDYRAYLGYAGYVTPSDTDKHFEIGVTALHVEKTYKNDYAEIYAGLITEHFSARVYYSPYYFREGIKTVYTELNSSVIIAKRWKAAAHMGYLTPLSGLGGHGYGDLGLSLGRPVAALDFQLAWSYSFDRGRYTGGASTRGGTITTSVRYAF